MTAPVLEAPSPTMQHFPAQEMPPFAANSNSQTQAVEINPGNGQEKTHITPKNIGKKLIEYTRHLLGPKHLFGSAMTVLYLIRWTTNVQSTYPKELQLEKPQREHGRFDIRTMVGTARSTLDMTRNVLTPGNVKTAVKETNNPARAMMAGSYLALFTNLLVFFLQRGGVPPQGENLGQKTFNAFRHPNLSTMFLNCVMMGSALLAISGGKVAGGLSQLKKIKDGAMLDTVKNQTGGNNELAKEMLDLNRRAETMRVASGLFYLVAAPITYISMFNMGNKKDKEQPAGQQQLTPEQEIEKMKTMANFQASQTRVLSFSNLKKALEPYNPQNVAGALGHAFKNDKAGIIARGCMVAAEALQMGEGWARGMKKADVLRRAGADEKAIKDEVAGAKKTMIAGTWGAILTIGHAIYAYGRVLAESRQKATHGQEMVR